MKIDLRFGFLVLSGLLVAAFIACSSVVTPGGTGGGTSGGTGGGTLAISGSKWDWGHFGSGGGPPEDTSALYVVMDGPPAPTCSMSVVYGTTIPTVLQLEPDAQQLGAVVLHESASEYHANVLCGGAACSGPVSPVSMNITAFDTTHVAFDLACPQGTTACSAAGFYTALLGSHTASICP